MPNNKPNSGELNWKENDGIDALISILNEGGWQFKLPPSTPGIRGMRDLPNYLKRDNKLKKDVKKVDTALGGLYIEVPLSVTHQEWGPEIPFSGYLKINFTRGGRLKATGTYEVGGLEAGIWKSNNIYITRQRRMGGGRRKQRSRRRKRTRKKRRRRRYRGGANCSLKGGLCNMFKSSGHGIKNLGSKIAHGSKKVYNGLTPGCPPDCRYTT